VLGSDQGVETRRNWGIARVSTLCSACFYHRHHRRLSEALALVLAFLPPPPPPPKRSIGTGFGFFTTATTAA